MSLDQTSVQNSQQSNSESSNWIIQTKKRKHGKHTTSSYENSANKQTENWEDVNQEGSEASMNNSRSDSESESESDLDKTSIATDNMQDEQLITENVDDEVIENYQKRLSRKDNTVIFDLFELLIKKMSSVQNDMKELKQQQRQVSQKFKTINKVQHSSKRKTSKMAKDTDDANDTNLKVVQAIIREE